MKFIGKPHQDTALEHLTAYPRCALWAGMGMGKTVTALNWVQRLILQGIKSPTLILAPTLVAESTWPQEAEKWDHLRRDIRVSPVLGTERHRRKALAKDANVFTINYENLPWLVELYGERWPFRTIIADESTRLKSFRLRNGGLRAEALGKVAWPKVQRFVELTGTPSPNGLKDLWGQLYMLDKGARLGKTYTSFKERWFRPSPDGYGVIPFPHTEGEIHSRVSDICLTLNPADYFNLDEPIVVNRYVDLPLKAKAQYRKMEKEFFYEIEGRTVEAFHAATKSQKLLQLASGAVYVDPHVQDDHDPRSKIWKQAHDVKIQALQSIVNEAAGMPVLVAYHFRSDRERLAKAFPQGVVLTRENNLEVQDAWNAGRVPVLFAHPASAGHGLNFQRGGNIIVYFSHDWNLEHRLQILERIGPMRQFQAGLKRPVFVYNIIAKDTVDEIVIDRTDGKKSVQDALLNSTARRR